jgi:hypothetical protein
VEHPPEPPSAPKADELARLRSEVARLEAERASEPALSTRTGVWRPIVAGVLIAIAALLAPLAVVAVWAHDVIGDTDRYVDTVAPLGSNPDVQRAIVDRVTTEIYTRLDIKDVTQDAVDALADRGLPPVAASTLGALSTPLASSIQDFIETQVRRLVHSDQFEEAWVDANREAHTQMVGVLTGKTGDTVKVQGDTVSVNLAVIIDAVKQRLVDRGFSLASRIPAVNAEFTILQSADLARAQTGVRILSTAARVLPWLAIALLAMALAISRSRRRSLVAGALAVAGSMVLLGIGLNAFRVVYLDAIPPDRLSPAAAGAVYDALTHFIRLNLRAVLVLFLAIAVIAWVTGPAPTPTAVRRGANHALDAVRHGSDRAGFDTGRLGVALDAYRTPLQAVVLGAALLIYVMAAHPTGAFTLVVLGVALLVLLVIELLARPGARSPET